MIKILRYLKPYILHIILLIGFTYLQVMASLALPDYMAKIVNQGIINEDQAFIWQAGLNMMLVTLGGAVCTVIVGFLASKIGTGFSKTLRKDVFTKIESFSLTEFNKFSIPSLITRSTNDIQQIQLVLIMLMRMILSAPITGIGAVIKAEQMAPSMTWIMGVAVALLMVLIIFLFFFAIPKFKLVQKLTDRLNAVTRQLLTGLRVIRAFNTEKYEEKRFDEVNQDFTKVNLFVNRLMAVMMPIMVFIFNIITIVIIWTGAHLVEGGSLQIGDMMAFMQYAMQVIVSFVMLSIVFVLVPRASVSADRIMEVLDTPVHIKDAEKLKKSDKNVKGLVEFKDVTFTYPEADTPVLYNISFTANPGEVTAIIGSTGSGKSTVINLIPRFFDVTSGQILVDGVNIKEMKQSELHSKIGYVPQKGVLFSGTVASNIAYGIKKTSEEEIKRAAKISQSEEFIKKLEGKYDYQVAQGGTNVSGGQKQRLSIARALAVNPEIFIFDDSFSALDFKTDAKLRAELKKETKGSTVIVVAQRIGTVLNADQIVVLDEGKVVGIGKHKELMKSCKVYKEIALSQLSEEELKNE